MAKVRHADSTIDGVRQPTIGAAMNDLKRAYWAAKELAQTNGNTELDKVLSDALNDICDIDLRVLDAICDLQENDPD